MGTSEARVSMSPGYVMRQGDELLITNNKSKGVVWEINDVSDHQLPTSSRTSWVNNKRIFRCVPPNRYNGFFIALMDVLFFWWWSLCLDDLIERVSNWVKVKLITRQNQLKKTVFLINNEQLFSRVLLTVKFSFKWCKNDQNRPNSNGDICILIFSRISHDQG